MEQFRLFTILIGLSHLNGERSINGLYHLLKGKKSSQTIQDAKLFKLEPFYHLMPMLQKSELNDCIRVLQLNECISNIGQDTFILSQKGIIYLKKLQEQFPIPNYLNGWRFHKEAMEFWQRVSLTIQTLSHLIYDEQPFLPVVRDVNTQHWVKSFVRTIHDRFTFADELYKECYSILKKLPKLHAEIFVLHLSGVHRVGFTIDQISRILRLDKEYTYVLFQSVLHFFILTVDKHRDHFPLLRSFIKEEKIGYHLTASARKTYELIKQNKSIEQIAEIRKLKMSTIEDHIVEIASEIEEFDIQPFISIEEQKRIKDALQTLQTKRLKPIRNALDNSVSYFQIRLMLGRMEK